MKNIPAFPAMHYDLADSEHGMTLRDYFAAKAMQAIAFEILKVTMDADLLASKSYFIADAMMKVRDE
jgi:hypothetical protein